RPEENWPIRVWVAKEAIAKASGLGMRKGLRNFQLEDIPTVADRPCRVRVGSPGPRPLENPAVRIFEAGPYWIGIAAEASALEALGVNCIPMPAMLSREPT